MRLYFKQQRSLSSWKAFPPHPPVTWAEEALSQRSTCNLTARSGPLMERGSLHVGLVRPCPALKCCPANGIPLRRHGVNDLTFCLKVVIDDDCLASCGCCELVAEATAAGLRAAGLLSSQQVRTYLSTRPEAFPGARQSPDWPSQPFPACAWASRPFNVPLAALLPSGVMHWQFDSSSRGVETDGRQGTVFRADSMRAERIHHCALWKDFWGLQEGRTKGK